MYEHCVMLLLILHIVQCLFLCYNHIEVIFMTKEFNKIEYNRKFNEKSYDRISVLVPKGQKKIIAEYCAERGESLNGFINRLINEAMRIN